MIKNNHNLFPVTLPANWQSPDVCNLNELLQSWLIDQHSLTARLKANSTSFWVELLGQHIEPCHVTEANSVIKPEEQVLVREVILYCDDKPQVFARSLIPLTSLTGQEHQLAHLGTQPLGQVLFNNPSLKREGIEFSCFDEKSSVATLCEALNLKITHELWGRRSIFVLENKPLMVAEVFLPSAFAYQENT
jgi:chorismate--pyruvate lyase